MAETKVGEKEVASGIGVQVASTLSSAVATGTTITPLDDTIPQITEGTEFMTVVITPKSITNTLVIDVTAVVAVSVVNGNPILALHQDSTANALAAIPVFQPGQHGESIMRLRYSMSAGTTSATTFRVRIGNRAAATVTLNGSNGARELGAITKSSIIVDEYKG